MTVSDYGSISFWHEPAAEALEPRPTLAVDEQVDVAIVGAGYTGLWTAHYLKRHEPEIRVAIVESEIAGFGASGSNRGWCLGTLAGIDAYFDDPARRDGAIRLQREMFETVNEIARVCEDEGIDCHWRKSGFINVATAEVHHAESDAESREMLANSWLLAQELERAQKHLGAARSSESSEKSARQWLDVMDQKSHSG